MKTILAHLKKDVALFRPLLWIWAILVGIDCLSFFDRIPFSHASGNAGLVVVSGLVLLVASGVASFVFQMLLSLLLVVRVIHADPLTESDAFWRTRPISRGALLAEKSLFIALLLMGTVFAALAIRFHSGNTSGAAMLLQIAVLVFGIMAFTVVTSNFSKLILTFIVTALGAGILAGIVLGFVRFLISMNRNLFDSMSGHVLFVSNSWQFGASAIYLVGFLTVIICQYLTLKTNISRMVLFATLFLAALLQGG